MTGQSYINAEKDGRHTIEEKADLRRVRRSRMKAEIETHSSDTEKLYLLCGEEE